MCHWLPLLVLLFTVTVSSMGQAQQKAADAVPQQMGSSSEQKTGSEPQDEEWFISSARSTIYFENDDPKKYRYQDIVAWSVYATNIRGNTLHLKCYGKENIFISLSGPGISDTEIANLGPISSYSEFRHPYFIINFSVDDDKKYNIEMTPRNPFHVTLKWRHDNDLILSAVYDEDKLQFLHNVVSAKHDVSIDVGGKTYTFKTIGAAEPLNKLLYKCKNPDESAIYSQP